MSKVMSSSRIKMRSSSKRVSLAIILSAMMMMCSSSSPSMTMAYAFAPKLQTALRTVSCQGTPKRGISTDFSMNMKRSKVTTITTSRLSSTTSDEQTSTLSAQERILKEALGIDPETEEERNTRIQKRQDTLNKGIMERRKNITVAVLAFMAAILNYAWQYTHPITSLSLLSEMQRNSADLTVIGNNGKPTVVDFWAPWCINCKEAAPTLYAIEEEYKDSINFVMVNGDLGENWPIIERFGVDAIPHLAMVSADGYVETALIGPIPRGVLRADLDTMLENGKRVANENGEVSSTTSGKKALPYIMYDAFRSRPDLRYLSELKQQ